MVVSRWIGPGNRTFLEVASKVVTWWIVAFLSSDIEFGNTEYIMGIGHFVG